MIETVFTDELLRQCVGGMFIRPDGAVLPVRDYFGHNDTIQAHTRYATAYTAVRDGWIRVGFPRHREDRMYVEFQGPPKPALKTLRALLRLPLVERYSGLILDANLTNDRDHLSYVNLPSRLDDLDDADIHAQAERWLNKVTRSTPATTNSMEFVS